MIAQDKVGDDRASNPDGARERGKCSAAHARARTIADRQG
jgi:hypothetical protein